jgi:hypothetical protein
VKLVSLGDEIAVDKKKPRCDGKNRRDKQQRAIRSHRRTAFRHADAVKI